MIQSFRDSYEQLLPLLNEERLVTPEEVRRDPVLQRAADMGDMVLKYAFSHIFSKIEGMWGINEDGQPNAGFIPYGNEAIVLLTTGLCRELNEVGVHFASSDWLAENPGVRELYDPCKGYVSPAQCAELIYMYGVAVTLGHELGHHQDLSHLSDIDATDALALQAEEISADGHAIRACLHLVDDWAADRAPGAPDAQDALRKLGAVFLVLASCIPLTINTLDSWASPEGEGYPRGAQRLAGTCVHVYEHFGKKSGFAATLYMAVLSGLAEYGIYSGPSDIRALILLISNFDSELVEGQYSAFKYLLEDRQLIDAIRRLNGDSE